MIVSGIIYGLGVLCGWAILMLMNHGTGEADLKFSGTEIVWLGIGWPLVVPTLIAIEVHCRLQRRRS
jgi:uncharacterized membrane protein